MKYTIYGGSFDPFHLGHLRLIQAVLEQKLTKRLIVMPLGLAPHKKHVQSMATYRLEMVKRAVKNLKNVTVSDYEIKRPGKYSYTVDTVEHFRDLAGKSSAKVELIYGSDALFSIEDWHRPAEIMANAKLMIAVRGHENREVLESQKDYLVEKYGAKIKLFTMEPTDISSTDLRADLQSGKDISKYVPAEVNKFLQANQPYAYLDDLGKLALEQRISLARLEQKITPLLSTYRLLHTLNVMHLAIHLASKHNYDLMKAALAGLLHDCTKDMPLKDQFKYAKKAGAPQVMNKNIAHGPAGSYYAKRFLGITDPEILTAIYYHTTSRVLMSTLDQIIYLADKCELGRPYKNLDKLRDLADRDLTAAMKLCFAEVQQAFQQKGKKLHPLTVAAIKSLNNLQ